MLPRIRRLSTRLFMLLSIWTIVAIVLIVILISNSYRSTAEDRLAELLTANLYNLMGVVTVDEFGKLVGDPRLGDPRFDQFDSGWFWSVTALKSEGNTIQSGSLAGRNIADATNVRLDDQFQRSYDLRMDNDANVRVTEAQVFLGEGDTVYSFKVTGDLDAHREEVSAFRNQLFGLMALFGASVVLVSYFLLRWGLRPLSWATDDLQNIRDGKIENLSGDYPLEIQPLIDETNALIKSNHSIVERARTQVGNLAHSLKTPLAVMQNEASQKSSVGKKLAQQQISQMREQIQVYLDRARIAARHGTVTSRCEVNSIVAQLARVIGKLNPQLDVETEDQTTPGNLLIFHGEKNDLQEILGNLVENAAKFANQKIAISTGLTASLKIEICVDDDGIGLSESDAKQAMKRGKRLDETKQGSGLGLSIVHDIAKEYEGSFELGRSKLGGLKATVILPGSVQKG